MVPATLAERDESAEDTTVCAREAEVTEVYSLANAFAV